MKTCLDSSVVFLCLAQGRLSWVLMLTYIQESLSSKNEYLGFNVVLNKLSVIWSTQRNHLLYLFVYWVRVVSSCHQNAALSSWSIMPKTKDMKLHSITFCRADTGPAGLVVSSQYRVPSTPKVATIPFQSFPPDWGLTFYIFFSVFLRTNESLECV